MECRFCFDGVQTNENKLISPCLCCGTQKYVHENCLAAWRQFANNSNHCEVCGFLFIFENDNFNLENILEQNPLYQSLFSLFIGLCMILFFYLFFRMIASKEHSNKHIFYVSATSIGIALFMFNWTSSFPALPAIFLLCGSSNFFRDDPIRAFGVAMCGYLTSGPILYHQGLKMIRPFLPQDHIISRAE